MVLERFGIYGWGSIEPILIPALTAKLPVLFMGTHGSAKTDGAVALIRILTGPNAKVQKYDVPNLQADELLGFPNPSDLAAGRPMTYIPTPISVWDKTGIILDELNRAQYMTQNKIIELIREGSVMGMPTAVEYVIGAVNPPQTYGSMYMELALASRFIVVRVPDLADFDAPQLTAVLNSKITTYNSTAFLTLIQDVRDAVLDPKAIQQIQKLVIQVALYLQSVLAKAPGEPGYSVRSMKMLYKLIDTSEKLRLQSDDYALLVTDHTLLDLILSTIPEVWGITSKTVQRNIIVSELQQILSGFSIGAATIHSVNIDDLLAMDLAREDIMAWGTNVLQKAQRINSISTFERTVHSLRPKLKFLPQDVGNSILLALLERAAVLGLIPLNSPLTDEGLRALLQKVFGI